MPAYASPNFRGCPFINAVLEIADASYKGYQVSIDLRESICQIFMQSAAEAGSKNQDFFPRQYLLLIGGVSLIATLNNQQKVQTLPKLLYQSSFMRM